MADSAHDNSAERLEVGQFVELLAQHQLHLLRFVFPLVGNLQDAEDVVQEVSKSLWENAANFRPDTNFMAWARQIAYFRVLKFRREKLRRPLQLSEEVLQTLCDRSSGVMPQLNSQREALEHCLAKLRPNDRQLIQARYNPEVNLAELAAELNRPLNSLYKSLGRVRVTLLACVERRLAAEQDR